jgi:hypothetical protein
MVGPFKVGYGLAVARIIAAGWIPFATSAPVPIEGCRLSEPPIAGMVAVPTMTRDVGGT